MLNISNLFIHVTLRHIENSLLAVVYNSESYLQQCRFASIHQCFTAQLYSKRHVACVQRKAHWTGLTFLPAKCIISQLKVHFLKSSDRLPLLSTRPAVTFPAKEITPPPLASTKLYWLVTKAHWWWMNIGIWQYYFHIGLGQKSRDTPPRGSLVTKLAAYWPPSCEC